MTQPETTTIAIVGAGPVGLMLAAELGMRGVPAVLLGDSAGVSTHPKANTHGARSMEIYRRHGLSDRLRERSPSKDYRTDVAYYTRLLGHELHRVSLPSSGEAIAETRQPGTRWPTPEPQFRSSQLVLEPLLLERARQFPIVDIRFNQRVVGLAQDAAGVDLEVEGADDERKSIRADYVVGADGGRSFVRQAIGTRLLGEGGLELDFMGGRMQATYFRAPGLEAMRRHPHAWQQWFILPHLRALLLTLDPDGGLYLLHYQLPADGTPAKPFQEVLDEVVGAPTPAQVISSADWRAGVSLVAERFRIGRCFLAGDAAHLFTPTGGFGVNTGIEDAVNLAWKLAGVTQGWAGEALLDTYEAERKPTALRNTSYALTLARRNGECPVGAEIEAETDAGARARADASRHLAAFARWEFDTPGIQLGLSYRSSPAIIDDGAAATPDDPTEYAASAAAGQRLPHVWLPGGGSLYDRLGQGFTLIDLCEAVTGAGWRDAAAARGVPLEILHLPGADELRALAGAELLLVRPDQHIAWRGVSGDPGAILDVVTGNQAAATQSKLKLGETA